MIIIRIIFVERLLFDKEVKESLNKTFKSSGIKITYYDGYIVMFDKVSVRAITPHRLIFSKNGDNLIVLYYDEYYEDDDLFFVNRKKYNLNTIKKYIRNYFKNKSNINVKTNNK